MRSWGSPLREGRHLYIQPYWGGRGSRETNMRRLSYRSGGHPLCRTRALLPEHDERIHHSRRFRSMTKHLALLALAAVALAACDQNRSVTNPGASFETSLAAQRVDAVADGQRAVYTLTNQVAGNAVAVFNRAADGTLTAAGTVATR